MKRSSYSAGAVVSIVVVASLWGAIPAQAVPITFNFSGTFTSVSNPRALYGNPAVGSPFTGSYTFDSAWLDSVADPEQGSYSGGVGAPYLYSVNFPGYTYTFQNVEIGTLQNSPPTLPNYVAIGQNGDVNGTPLLGINQSFIVLQSSDSWGAGTDTLPIVAPLLSDFDLARFFSIRQLSTISRSFEFTGTIDSLTAVPLPAALPLFAGGLGLMGLVRWARKRRRGVEAPAA